MVKTVSCRQADGSNAVIVRRCDETISVSPLAGSVRLSRPTTYLEASPGTAGLGEDDMLLIARPAKGNRTPLIHCFSAYKPENPGNRPAPISDVVRTGSAPAPLQDSARFRQLYNDPRQALTRYVGTAEPGTANTVRQAVPKRDTLPPDGGAVHEASLPTLTNAAKRLSGILNILSQGKGVEVQPVQNGPIGPKTEVRISVIGIPKRLEFFGINHRPRRIQAGGTFIHITQPVKYGENGRITVSHFIPGGKSGAAKEILGEAFYSLDGGCFSGADGIVFRGPADQVVSVLNALVSAGEKLYKNP